MPAASEMGRPIDKTVKKWYYWSEPNSLNDRLKAMLRDLHLVSLKG